MIIHNMKLHSTAIPSAFSSISICEGSYSVLETQGWQTKNEHLAQCMKLLVVFLQNWHYLS